MDVSGFSGLKKEFERAVGSYIFILSEEVDHGVSRDG
jgi:hypothetical protein